MTWRLDVWETKNTRMLSLTAHLVLISTIIVKCSAFSKKPSERAKPAAVKKAVEDKQPVKVTAFEQASLNEDKAEAMSNIEPSPKISNSTVPTAPTPKKEKKVVATTKKTERSVAQGPPLVSEHIKDEKKMPSVHKPIRKGSIYANELLTEKPLTDTEPELHPDNHVVKAKSPKPVARTPTARHRNANQIEKEATVSGISFQKSEGDDGGVSHNSINLTNWQTVKI